MTDKGITRLGVNGHPTRGMSPWSEMPLVGDAVGNAAPTERFFRAFDKVIDTPSEVRAGVWEATAYAEKITDYPYNEIVFVVEGSISILDEDKNEERFEPGDCFFLEKGFNGEWRQHSKLKIFHMTVDPSDR